MQSFLKGIKWQSINKIHLCQWSKYQVHLLSVNNFQSYLLNELNQVKVVFEIICQVSLDINTIYKDWQRELRNLVLLVMCNGALLFIALEKGTNKNEK